MTQPDLTPGHAHQYKEGSANVQHSTLADGRRPATTVDLPPHNGPDISLPVNSILRLGRRLPNPGGGGSRVRFSRVYPVYTEPEPANQSDNAAGEKGEMWSCC